MRQGLEVTPAGGRTRLRPYAEVRQTQGSYVGEEVPLQRGGRLPARPPGAPYTFRVYIVDVPVFNAFAAPGGTGVVFRGLLERTDSPEQLAGVLAHELQHVVQRHSTRAIVQHTSSGLLIAALTGDVTGPLAYGLEAARVLGQLRYSRDAEEEADTEGLKMLLAARVDPAGMIAFFKALDK